MRSNIAPQEVSSAPSNAARRLATSSKESHFQFPRSSISSQVPTSSMSFFYGANSSTPANTNTNISSLSPFDKVVLPGHNFKNGFMTSTIFVVTATIIALVTIAMINRRVPYILEPPKPTSNGKPRKIHLTDWTGGLCFWYLL